MIHIMPSDILMVDDQLIRIIVDLTPELIPGVVVGEVSSLAQKTSFMALNILGPEMRGEFESLKRHRKPVHASPLNSEHELTDKGDAFKSIEKVIRGEEGRFLPTRWVGISSSS
jgi:hypothetical protein